MENFYLFNLRLWVILLSIAIPALGHSFHIECPPDVTISCEDDIYDLSGYGWAYVYGYGSPVPADDPVVNYNINNCNTGTITRTWSAYDYSGNFYSCTQTITVGGNGNFNEHDINWPPDYTTTECTMDLDPDDLPPPFDRPTFDQEECAMPMMSYKDIVFNIAPPACKKILRKWTVIDWCTYQPNNHYSGGIWHHTQVIKVLSDEEPEIFCPDDVTVSSGLDCEATFIQMDSVYAIGGCGSEVEIINNSPYADDNGADASGTYPAGTTHIKFTAIDGCGSKATCIVSVTVVDQKKPTPVCISFIATTLMVNQDGYYLDLDPKWFDKSSFDNCTPVEDLIFTIDPDRVTCDDLGLNDIRMTVIDESGNSQHCDVTLQVQDNMNMCPPDTSTLSGAVTYVTGDPIPDAEIMINAQVSAITDENGLFSIPEITGIDEAWVNAHLYDLDQSGLSTLDIILIGQHILGQQPFQSVESYIAADVNHDQSISALDLIQLQQYLLGNLPGLPHEEWMLLPQEYQGDMQNPYPGPDDMSYYFLNLRGDHNDLNFIALEMGDVNHSFNLMENSVEERNADIMMEAVFTETPTHIQVDFTATSAMDLLGLQMSPRADDQLLEYSHFSRGLLDITEGDLGFSLLDEGAIKVLWYDEEGVAVEKGDILFSFIYNKLGVPEIGEDLLSLSDILSPEMYDNNFNTYRIQLENIWNTLDAKNTLPDEWMVNYSLASSELSVIAPETKEYIVSIVDITGRLVNERKLAGSKILPLKESLYMPGVYHGIISTDYFTHSVPIIIQ